MQVKLLSKSSLKDLASFVETNVEKTDGSADTSTMEHTAKDEL